MLAHLATTTPDGPILRTLHPIHTEDGTWFHGRATGEKARAIGRAAVITTESVICRVPSYVFDPARACPATTYFETSELRGALVVEEDPARKAAILQRMMEQYQAEGGYVPITADDPRYRQSVRNLLVFGVRGAPTQHVKIGQEKPVEVRLRVLRHLWDTGQVDAVDRIRALAPDLPDPEFLRSPARLFVSPHELCPGLEATYWNEGIPLERLQRAHGGSSAWIVAKDGERVVASARALGDGAKYAWIYDVIVVPEWRGRGLGDAVMRALLEHPAVRDCARVLLATKDADGFYRRMGFRPRGEARKRPYPSIELVLERDRPIGPLV